MSYHNRYPSLLLIIWKKFQLFQILQNPSFFQQIYSTKPICCSNIQFSEPGPNTYNFAWHVSQLGSAKFVGSTALVPVTTIQSTDCVTHSCINPELSLHIHIYIRSLCIVILLVYREWFATFTRQWSAIGQC